MPPKITNKISLNKTFNNFHRKNAPEKKHRHNLYSGFCVKVDWQNV